jgi:Tol biopolymer transport system component
MPLGLWWVVLVLVFPAGMATGAQSPAVPEAARELAAEVRDKGWIGYAARSEAGDWDLYVCRPDGSERRNLTTTPERNEFAPQFSRDGRKLLYRRIARSERIDDNRHGEQGELIIANSDGSDPTALGEAGEFPWGAWSPDGRQIASLSVKGIAIVDLATRKVARTLARKGFFQQIAWSPDGQWLVGVANSFGTGWSIARMNLATGEAGAINRVDCCTPDWFPDGAQVIFSWRPPGQRENQGQGWTQLWRADAAGKERELVYGEDGRHVYGGHVSPDGKYVLFTGNMREDGDPGNAGAPMGLMRLKDGPIIGGASADLRAKHPKAGNGPVLALPVGWEPCWTFADLRAPAGPGPVGGGGSRPASLAAELRSKGWLVFSARSDAGDWDLFVMRPDGTGRRAITRTTEYNEAGARFSPDGGRLLYYRLPKSEVIDNNSYGTFDLVVTRADGSAPVVYGNAYPWASWGPDGARIACLGAKGIQVIDLTTRQVARQLPRKGIVGQLYWSPDGKRFVGTANGLGPFWNIGVLDPEPQAIHAVSETERYNCTPDWCPDSRRVVYARGIIPERAGRAELWVADAAGGGRERIYAEADRHIYGACASPDGRYALFTRSSEDLGKVPEIEMAIIRWPGPGDPREAGKVERLDLGPGWEPHWTFREYGKQE